MIIETSKVLTMIEEHETNNMRVYGVTCNQIRDFCAVAINSGRLPDDSKIDELLIDFYIGDCGQKVTAVL